ncbi:MAG TPA: preprotein translocase subunit SecG [Gammaproteobacteria bacterium]|jgi:preprotein translocase subunit SecG|nr:preprotein translocase subunit SecG [Gammaproteobacteria bacterium]
MLHSIVLVVHALVALMIIGLVLLQRGKGAEAGTGFGAGASGTVFGARGSANFLSHATGVLATLFFMTSLALAYLSTQRTTPTSVLDSVPAQQAPAPQAPAPAPAGASELPQLPSDSGSGAAGNAPAPSPESGSGNAPHQ